MKNKLRVAKIVFYITMPIVLILMQFQPFNKIMAITYNVVALFFVGVFTYDLTNYVAKKSIERLAYITERTVSNIYITRTIVFTVIILLVSTLQYDYFSYTQTPVLEGCIYYDQYNNPIYESEYMSSCPDLDIIRNTDSELVFEVLENKDHFYETLMIHDVETEDIGLENVDAKSYTKTTVTIKYNEEVIEYAKYSKTNFSDFKAESGTSVECLANTSKIADFTNVIDSGYVFKLATESSCTNGHSQSDDLTHKEFFDDDYDYTSYSLIQSELGFTFVRNTKEDEGMVEIELGTIEVSVSSSNEALIYKLTRELGQETRETRLYDFGDSVTISNQIIMDYDFEPTNITLNMKYLENDYGLFFEDYEAWYYDQSGTGYKVIRDEVSQYDYSDKSFITYAFSDSNSTTYYQVIDTDYGYIFMDYDYYEHSIFDYLLKAEDSNTGIYYGRYQSQDVIDALEDPFENFTVFRSFDVYYNKPVFINDLD